MEGSGGGGEVRRIHVVYLLSRMGRMEQPHLFRVHHLARSGVRLKDVKRWLGELRGENMPDSFSWSYKRRYKTGFVWQDLRDDDLITPISDNEYVLKGSEIHSATVQTNPCCYREKSHAVKKLDPAPPSPEKELAGGSAEDPPASISGGDNKELAGKGSECSSPSSSSSLSSFSSSSFAAASECSKEAKPANGAGAAASPGGGVFRSLLSCGVVDTSDASILRGARRPAGGATPDGVGGSARFFSNSDWFQSSETRMKWRSFSSLTGLSVKPKKKEKMEDGDELSKEGSEHPLLTHAIEPLCSQCGKGFRPEKLQTHMKSCKGLKSKAKMGSFAATETPSLNKRAFSFFL